MKTTIIKPYIVPKYCFKQHQQTPNTKELNTASASTKYKGTQNTASASTKYKGTENSVSKHQIQRN